MKMYEALGGRIREAREARGLDQLALAKALNPPVGQQAVSGWERGASRPRLAMVRSLAQALDVPEEELAELGKYAGADASALPLEQVLPFDTLSEYAFEAFCRDLLSHEHGGANAYIRGGRGHKQGGFDVMLDIRGERIGVQVKRREDFGPGKVHEAVRAADPALKVTRPQIALSRAVASPRARDAIAEHDGWELFDGTGLSERVRRLDPDRAAQLVGKWFPKHLKSFLGVEHPSMWLDVADWVPASTGAFLFDTGVPFVGRAKELEELRAAVSRGGLIVVEAGAGSGKSRLIVEFAQGAQRDVRVAEPRLLDPKQFDLLPTGAPVIVVDDAGHDPTMTVTLVRGIFRERPESSVILTVQPTRRQVLDLALKDVLNASPTIVTLEDLTPPQAKKLALAIIGEDGTERIAEAIASIGYDCPLVVVQASKLYAQGGIELTDLVSSGTLHDTVWLRSIESQELPAGALEVLEAIALVQPLRLDDPNARDAVEDLSGVSGRKLERAFDALQDAGLVAANGNSRRVVPDLLGEALVARQISPRSGIDASAVDVASRLQGALLLHALFNATVADWHARRAGSTEAPSARLWDAVAREITAATTSTRAQMLAEIEPLGRLNPLKAIELVKLASSQASADADPQRTDVLRAAAPFLAKAGEDISALPDVVRMLFEIGREDSRAENQTPEHAMRLLRELGSYHPRRGESFHLAYVAAVKRLVVSAPDDATRAAAIGLLEPLTATRAEWTSAFDLTITMHTSAIALDRVASVRDAVLQVATEHCLGDARTARAATTVLGALLRTADDEREFEAALALLVTVLQSETVHPLASLDANEALLRAARFGDERWRGMARDARAGLRDDRLFVVVRQMVSMWDWMDDGDFGDDAEGSAIERLDELARVRNEAAREALLAQIKDGTSLREALADGLHSISRVGAEPAGLGALLWYLLESGSFLATDITGSVAASAMDDVDCLLTQAPLAWSLRNDPVAALGYATELAGTGPKGAGVVARAIAHSPDALGEALASGLVDTLVDHGDSGTLRPLISAAARSNSAREASATITRIGFGSSQHLAHEAAMALVSDLSSGEVPWLTLTPVERASLLDQFTDTPDIDDHWIGKLLDLQLGLEPFEVLRLMQRRIERLLEDGTRYFVMPLDWRDAPSFSKSVAQEPLLRAALAWFDGFEDRRHRREGAQLLTAIAEGFGPGVQRLAVDIATGSAVGGPEGLRSVLAAAPRDFVFDEPTVVSELVGKAMPNGQEMVDAVISGCVASSVPSFGSRTIGEPDPTDVARKARAEQILASLGRDDPVRPLYEKLVKVSDANLRWQEESDRNFPERRRW